MNSRSTALGIKTLYSLAASALLAVSAQADVIWQGPVGNATYNSTANWVGGVIPSGTGVNADNNLSSNNIITLSATDPTWTHGDQRLGDVANSSGAMIQTGSTNIVGTVGGSWFREGDSAGSAGYYWLSNGVMQVGGNTHVGEVGFGYLEMDGGVLNQPGSGGIFVLADSDQSGGTPTGVVVINNGVINSANQVWIGEGDSAGTSKRGTGFLTMNGGTFNCTNWFVIGRFDGVGTMTMTNGYLQQCLNQFQIAPGGTGHSQGTLNVGGTASINILNTSGSFDMADGTTAQATLNQSGGTITCASGNDIEYWIGNNGFATNNMSGGQLIVNNWFAVGRGGNGVTTGILNLSGGTITKQGANHMSIASFANGTGVINQTGGFITQTVGMTWLGQGGNGTWNMSGGTNVLGGITNGSAAAATGTLNLSGGVMATPYVRGGSGSSLLNFSNGMLRATASSTSFVSNISTATIDLGVVIDSQGFNITIPENLNDGGMGGGLTKLGTGTLVLSGYNDYSGPTIVSNGDLVLYNNANQQGDGSYTVEDGATLEVWVTAGQNSDMDMSGLALGNSSGATLNFNLGAVGNPTQAPVVVSSSVNVNAPVTVNIADGLYTVGEIPLITATGFTGSGNFVLGTLPLGVQANLTIDPTTFGSPTLALQITSAGLPKWAGILADNLTLSSNWDINITSDWIEQSTSASATYKEGNPVLFDDTAAGSTTVNVMANVHPSLVTFTNDYLAYTIVGNGSISGATALVVSGTNTVTIDNTNSYTGPTIINGQGEVIVTNLANGGTPSPIGAASSNPTNLVFAGGGLSYTGAAVSVNRGFSLLTTSNYIDAESNLTFSGQILASNNGVLYKMGPAQLAFTGGFTNQIGNGTGAGGTSQAGFRVMAGTLVFDGSAGNQFITNSGEFWVGATTNSGAGLILTNTSMYSSSWASVSRGTGNSNFLSTLTLYNSTLACANMSIGYNGGLSSNIESSVITLNNSTITNFGGTGFNFAESTETGPGSTHTLYLNGSSKMGLLNRWLIAMGGNTVASAYVSNTASIFDSFYISVGDGGVGSMLLANNGSVTTLSDFNVSDVGANSVGLLSMQDNAQLAYNNFYVGKGSNGVVTLLGGTLSSLLNTNATTAFQVGVNSSTATSVFNQSGGSVIASNNVSIGFNSGALGVVNLSGGTFLQPGPTYTVTVGSSGTGTLNISNSASVVDAGMLNIGTGAIANGTVNLAGGSLTVSGVSGSSGLSTFNFNGGTLVAGPNANASFLSALTAFAYVQSGGAVIDSGTNVIGISQALLNGTGGGGLTKLGVGTLDLSSSGNTYTGTTLVSAGALGGTGTLVSPVTVSAAGTLAPGTPAAIGTLTINNNLTLSGGVAVKVNKTLVQSNDTVVVSGTLTGGSGAVTVNNLGVALQTGDKFTLFSKPVSGGAAMSVSGGGVASWVNNLAVDGSISVGSTVSLTPVTLTNVYSGGTLTLSWPSDHKGWRLEAQTNSLGAGLNASTWTTVNGSTTTVQEIIQVDPAAPTVFYRLTYP